MRAGDAEALHARRNDPDVARYQTWITPWPRSRADEIIAGAAAMDGPQNGEWWMLTIADRQDAEVIGDLVALLTWDGRCAEIGYSLAREHWGKGYAVEGAAALVEWLFETFPLTRAHGMLHPDNPASAQVLERVGMLFEGHTRLSFWVGDDNSDDHLYGMTRDDWMTWRSRPRQPPTVVELVEMDFDIGIEARAVRVHKTQERFVATVTQSFADALVPPEVDGHPVVPWLRGVRVDGELIGFVMLAEPTEHHPEPFLWRLIVDRLHQRRGIGARILALVEDQCRSWGSTGLLVSWGEGRGSPRPFYERHGFVPTGEISDGETVARKTLDVSSMQRTLG